MLGGCDLGGAYSYIKASGPAPFIRQGKISTEGMWGQYPFSILGRTLGPMHVNLTQIKRYILTLGVSLWRGSTKLLAYDSVQCFIHDCSNIRHCNVVIHMHYEECVG